jgi:hypothetical protein
MKVHKLVSSAQARRICESFKENLLIVQRRKLAFERDDK